MSWPDSFQAHRRLRMLNLVAQAFLFLAMFAGLNYLALHFSWRFDFARQRLFAVSAETRAYIQHLEKPIHVVVAFQKNSEDNDINQARKDALTLLREYAYISEASGKARITIEELDIYKQRQRAESLGITATNTFLFLCGNPTDSQQRRRFVGLDELYQIKEQQKKAFLGERAFTSAMLDVASPQKQRVYFLVGHGEMALESVDPARGISQFRDALRARNYDVAPLDIAQTRAVPEDASLVVVLAPQSPLLPQEQEVLRRYLSTRAGNIIIAIEPARPHGLDTLLHDWGIVSDDAIVVDTSPDFMADGGDLIFRHYGNHPTTQTLIDNQIPLVTGFARPVRADTSRPLDDTLRLRDLVAAGSTAWGERSYRQGQAEYNPGIDVKGAAHLPIAIVSERVTASNLSFSVPAGRVIVFGTADFLSNNRIGMLGNLSLGLNCVNWTTKRDSTLNIPPRTIERYQLALSQTQLTRLQLILIGLAPATAAILGFLIFLARRR